MAWQVEGKTEVLGEEGILVSVSEFISLSRVGKAVLQLSYSA